MHVNKDMCLSFKKDTTTKLQGMIGTLSMSHKFQPLTAHIHITDNKSH